MSNEGESGGGSGYSEKITITLDRRTAEDLYYDLLLALGGRDYGEDRVGKNGKTGSKDHAAVI